MTQDWETQWKDYYETLQVHPSAEPEVVKAAYDRLARKYHPDITTSGSTDRIADINEAYAVLSDPDKRALFDKQWRQRQGMTWAPPKPTVMPLVIRFENVEAHSVVKSSFVLQNSGGTYTKPVIQDPDSWVRVVRADPVSPNQSDPLPARVEIEAEGQDWDSKYTGYIMVRLINEEARVMGETRVKVELNTKPPPEGQTEESPRMKPPRPLRAAPARDDGWVYLLIDCSGSMAGDKLAKAKLGAAGFAKEAISKGYSVGLVSFYGIANHLCEPTKDMGLLQSNIDRLQAKKAGKARRFIGVFHRGAFGTNIAAAIRVARQRLSNRTGTRAIVIITDGQPNASGDPDATLRAGKRATRDGIDIITIGTDDADQRFLNKLASTTELSMKVSRQAFQETIVSAANLLSDGR